MKFPSAFNNDSGFTSTQVTLQVLQQYQGLGGGGTSGGVTLTTNFSELTDMTASKVSGYDTELVVIDNGDDPKKTY